MLGAVELLVVRLRIQRRLTTEEALEHGMRQIVVLADGAGGKPVAESPAVGKAGKFRGRRRVAVGVEDVVRVDRHVLGVVPQARREVDRKSVVEGKRGEDGGRRDSKKKTDTREEA